MKYYKKMRSIVAQCNCLGIPEDIAMNIVKKFLKNENEEQAIVRNILVELQELEIESRR